MRWELDFSRCIFAIVDDFEPGKSGDLGFRLPSQQHEHDDRQRLDRYVERRYSDNLLTALDPYWPQNDLWSPAAQAALLAGYGNFPHASPVGVGFALWTNRLTLADLAAGVPVRLSRFSTNVVSVSYTLETPAGLAAAGTLVFAPGQTVKLAQTSTNGLAGAEFVALRLISAVNGEITGAAEAFVLSHATTLIPPGAVWRFLDTGTNLETYHAAENRPYLLKIKNLITAGTNLARRAFLSAPLLAGL